MTFAIMICRSVCQIIYGNMRWVKQSTSSALQRFLSLNHPIIHDTYINKLPVVFIICVYRSDLDCCVRLIIFTRELINHISLSHCSRSTFDIFSTGSWLDETFLHCYFDALFTLHTQGQNTIDYSQGPLSLLFILLKKNNVHINSFYQYKVPILQERRNWLGPFLFMHHDLSGKVLLTITIDKCCSLFQWSA